MNIFSALAEPNRRTIVEMLARNGPLSATEISARFPVSPPAISQHLKVLKAAGLVMVRAEGTRRLYAVDTRGVAAMRNWLDGFWDKTLVAFKNAAEREAVKERKSR